MRMSKHPNPNLTQLDAREECLARVALANTPKDRQRLGLEAIIGGVDGSVSIINPDGTIDKTADKDDDSEADSGQDTNPAF